VHRDHDVDGRAGTEGALPPLVADAAALEAPALMVAAAEVVLPLRLGECTRRAGKGRTAALQEPLKLLAHLVAAARVALQRGAELTVAHLSAEPLQFRRERVVIAANLPQLRRLMLRHRCHRLTPPLGSCTFFRPLACFAPRRNTRAGGRPAKELPPRPRNPPWKRSPRACEPKEVQIVAVRVVIAAAVRTAIGTFGGDFREVPARRLAAACIREVVRRAHVDPAEVDEVILGCVNQVAEDAYIARAA